MRDMETMSVALQASGTGHLVLSTVHTSGAAASIERIVNMFPPHDKDQICFRLATCLRGVISQKLVPKADGTGRVAVVEVMVNTPTISKTLEEGQLGRLYTAIAEGGFWGMQTLNQSLQQSLQDKLITEDDAIAVSNNPMELRQMLRR
jgi:twitching motility protein PilT